MNGRNRSQPHRACSALAGFLALASCQAYTPDGSASGALSKAASKPKPLVVFISGFGVEAGTWQQLSTGLADVASTFAFERPGYGGSRLAPSDADGIRTADEVVALLDTALKERGVRRPFVLVAHSLGGQYALRYAKLHSRKVAALVLVDARMKDYTAKCSAVAPNCSPPPIRTETPAHMAAEIRGMPGIEAVMPEPEELGSTPVTVITRARGDQPQLGVWQQTQSAFSERLTNGRFVIAQNSGHFIYRDEEELVLKEISAALGTARAKGGALQR